MDARFVLVEIGKLTAKVDRLATDVGDVGSKVSRVESQLTFPKGAAWVILGLLSLSGVLTLVATGTLKVALG